MSFPSAHFQEYILLSVSSHTDIAGHPNSAAKIPSNQSLCLSVQGKLVDTKIMNTFKRHKAKV